ncbi:uroporphyrinogen-III C-methyltransferase [Halospina sp. K52047b]|nr:uroporphyrinogen-III C-methyltransferase [Halospina sp. K52047b]
MVTQWVKDRLRSLLPPGRTTSTENQRGGEVYLVGAGPGDPDLLTIKALRLLREADVVLHDRLVSPPIMDLINEDAEIIHVGKARSNHSVPQDRINELLVEYAQAGKRVVRLKGGDPFIFGRGGEEIERLAEHGVPFQVVPGITAAQGCSAYAGIPLTHRDHAQSVRFITGHLKNDTTDLPWQDFVQNRQTLVFYMGLVGLPVITRELVAHGMAAETPCALVSKGTTPDQQVVCGTLESIVEAVEQAEVRAPTIIIVGDVVSLRGQLGWLEQMPAELEAFSPGDGGESGP